jgi:hypothetical protein
MARINRKGKKNGSRSKTGTGYTYRVYCPVCPPLDMTKPQNNVSIPVDGTNTPSVVTCKAGHRTVVVK